MQWFQVRKYIFCFKNVLILEFFLWPIKLIVTDCTAIFDLNVNTTLTFSTNDVSCNVIKVKFYSNLCFLNLSKVIHKKLLENYVYLLSNSIHRDNCEDKSLFWMLQSEVQVAISFEKWKGRLGIIYIHFSKENTAIWCFRHRA